ncbi:MAG TPA: hypothetical protein EYQ25_05770 [Planctomycetes bacterium]|nr:hypothetical protein [Planctomycetota bacterium]HIL37338.1 hypothetical protein [Planctomycetota bacterium]
MRPSHLITPLCLLLAVALAAPTEAAFQGRGGQQQRGGQQRGQGGGRFAPSSDRLGGDNSRGARKRVVRKRGPADKSAMKDLQPFINRGKLPRGGVIPTRSGPGTIQRDELIVSTDLADDNQILQWFSVCDTDANGWLRFRETKAALTFDRPQFRAFDEDNDGRIKLNEFTDYYRYRIISSGGFRPPAVKTKRIAAPPRAATQLRLAFDGDANDRIDTDELTALLESYGRYDLTVIEVMEDHDITGDMQLNRDELEAITLLLAAANPEDLDNMPLASVAGVDELFGALAGSEVYMGTHPPRIVGPITPFRRLDLNGDGGISLADLEALQRPLRTNIRIHPILHALDANGDGFLDRAELRAALGDVR